MSALTRIFSSLLQPIRVFTSNMSQPMGNIYSLANGSVSQVSPGGPFSLSMRTIMRIHFPRPSERKRIKRHGFRARMSTPAGRRIIMNRILKGRHVYTH